MIQQQTNGNGNSERALTMKEILTNVATVDHKTALELAMQTTEMARIKLAESRTVQLDRNGQFIIRSLDGLMQLAHRFAASGVIPERFQGKVDDCAIAIQIAMRLKVDPLAVMQSLYVVHGNPSFDAKFSISAMYLSGLFSGHIKYEREGYGMEGRCRALVTYKETGELIDGPWITWETVVAEKWDQPRKGQPSKWTTIPEMMFRYRSASWLQRTYFPHLTMGFKTLDEMEDIHGVVVDERSGAVVEEEASEIRVRTAPVVAAPITLPQPPTETKTETNPEQPAVETVKEAGTKPESPPAETKTSTATPPEAKPEVAPVEKPESPPADTQESGPPNDREAVYEEWVAKLKMVRTVAGVESLTKQIHEGRAAMTGDQYEALLELSDSRRFELDRKSGKQRTF